VIVPNLSNNLLPFFEKHWLKLQQHYYNLFLQGLQLANDVFERVLDHQPTNYHQLKDVAIVVTKNRQLL